MSDGPALGQPRVLGSLSPKGVTAGAVLLNLEQGWPSTEGEGITVAIIDEHFERAWLPRQASVTVLTVRRDYGASPSHHGSVLAALLVGDVMGYRGVAPKIDLAAIELPAHCTAAEEALALKMADSAGASIVCCAWGPEHNDPSRMVLPDNVNDRLQSIGRSGRDGLGTVLFFAAPNGEGDGELDAYAGHPAVCAVEGLKGPAHWINDADVERIVKRSSPKEGHHSFSVVPIHAHVSSSIATGLAAGFTALLLSAKPELEAAQALGLLMVAKAPEASIDEAVHPCHGSPHPFGSSSGLPHRKRGTEAGHASRYRERRFNGGEHCYLGQLAAKALTALWAKSNKQPDAAFFGADFASFAPPSTAPNYSGIATTVIGSFFDNQVGAIVPARPFPYGKLPYGFLAGVAADVFGSPPDIINELKRHSSQVTAFINIFHKEYLSKFRDEFDIELALADIASTDDHLHFLDLARKNSSHFAGDNLLFYLSHHLVAITNAIWCGLATDSAVAEERFSLAIMSEAFAGHFLADMFSAAHARVPRWAFINKIYNTNPNRSDFISRLLHQHEGREGVFLSNAAGQVWYAYGDAGLLNGTTVADINTGQQWTTDRESLVFQSLVGGPTSAPLQSPRLAASVVFASLCDVFRHFSRGMDTSASAEGSGAEPTGLLGYVLNRAPYAPSSRFLTDSQRSNLVTVVEGGQDKVQHMDMKFRLADVEGLYETHKEVLAVVRYGLNHNFYSLDVFKRLLWEPELTRTPTIRWTGLQTSHLAADLQTTPFLRNVPGLLAGSEEFPSTIVEPYVVVSGDLPETWRAALPTKLANALTQQNGVFWIDEE